MAAGVRARILLAMMIMAVLTLASIGVGLLAFNSLHQQVSTITDERVPEVGTATDLIVGTGELTRELLAMSNAENKEGLVAARENVDQQITSVTELIEGLPAEVQQEFTTMLASVSKDIAALDDARERGFDVRSQLDATLNLVIKIGHDASSRIAPLVEKAYRELQDGGTGTIDAIDATLGDLVDTQFKRVSDTLQARADINLLAGVALARTTISDPGTLSILNDIGRASSNSLQSLLPELEANDAMADYMAQLREAADFYGSAFADGAAINRSSRGRYLEIRQIADSALSSALDDMVFTLTISAADAADANRTHIQGLLDDQVAAIRRLLRLDASLQEFINVALSTSLAEAGPALNGAQDKLDQAAAKLESSLTIEDGAVKAIAGKLLQVADPEKGIASKRKAFLDAVDSSEALTAQATSSVVSIGDRAGAYGQMALARITRSGAAVNTETSAAELKMLTIAGFSVVVILFSVFLIQRTLIRPLVQLTQTTERLAHGDMAAIEGFAGRKDEIGRMGQALSVFRDNSLKVEELNRENEARELQEKEARRAMFTTLAEEIGSVVTAASMGDFSRRVDRSFDDPEISKLGQDLNKLMDATESGLEGTRAALRAMADADLTHRMSDDYPGVFGELANDVNGTTTRLSDLIGNIRDSAATSSQQATQFTEGAQQLATRAEHQAATLEETASAMEEMSQTVKASSASLIEAESLSSQVAQKTETGSAAAKIAVENVELIQESSSKIHDIISVIENISFQTNLLALNAAVEAARAGDAGKGFAVVASEVRALAQRSTEAASEISELIRESTERVDLGVRSVEAARGSFQEIDTAVRPVIDLLSQIAESGKDQAMGIGEVSQAVNRMDEMTQENARLADMSGSMAAELSHQIATLEQMASSFRISTSGGPQAQFRPAAVEDSWDKTSADLDHHEGEAVDAGFGHEPDVFDEAASDAEFLELASGQSQG